MRRRALLAAVFATAGCLSGIPPGAPSTPTPSARERCADRRFPDRHIGVIRLEEADAPEDPASAVRLEDLPAGEQAILERAVEQGRTAICLPAASDDRVRAFGSLVDRLAEHSASVREGAVVERDGTYYRVTHLRTGDMVFVTASA